MIEMHPASITDEVESRLADIFGDADSDAPSGKDNGSEVNPLLELKATVLSLDWEITEEVMGRFIAQAEGIKGHYPQDKHVQTCGQILLALGKYMRVHRGGAHPDTVRLLNSAFACLEKILQSDGLKTPEKNRLVFKQIEAFKRLKEEIVKRRREVSREGRLQVEGGTGPKPLEDKRPEPRQGTEIPHHERAAESLPHPIGDALSSALGEIREMIRGEFEALRADLRSWLGAKQG